MVRGSVLKNGGGRGSPPQPLTGSECCESWRRSAQVFLPAVALMEPRDSSRGASVGERSPRIDTAQMSAAAAAGRHCQRYGRPIEPVRPPSTPRGYRSRACTPRSGKADKQLIVGTDVWNRGDASVRVGHLAKASQKLAGVQTRQTWRADYTKGKFCSGCREL